MQVVALLVSLAAMAVYYGLQIAMMIVVGLANLIFRR